MARGRPILASLLLTLTGLIALGAYCHRPLLRLMAAALVVDDRLEPSDAIVVVAGGTPSREARAAALFREGWAPRLIVSRPSISNDLRELMALGVRPLDLQGESRLALEKWGVPPDRIIALTEPAEITELELDLVHRLAQANGYRRIILVTSPEHTRRVKAIWVRADRKSGIEGIVVAAWDGDVPLDEWWRKRRATEAVLHEYLGLAAVYLGISSLMH